MIQGFGSPLTEALCNTPLGLTTLTHHLALPWWTPLLAGWAGTTLLLISLPPRALGLPEGTGVVAQAGREAERDVPVGDPRHARGGEGELDRVA
ncbi:hypothetical protein [Streptomyces jumonjinensis]|uniref:Uncharacterized protein n=1 Tax=Streptomyces jumonjinensis TaxID=1945 RepID=A0A646KG81_STRJU|nr:hypothetical protein [Streptomyces jumonjinensis]MQT01292.1 hypothetical protein [Streptomyces jumonjinensis]